MITLKGVFPNTKPRKCKNFIRANVINIRRISVQSSKEDKDKSDESKNKCPSVCSKERKNKRDSSANVLFSKRNNLSQENRHVVQSKKSNETRRLMSRSNIDLMKSAGDSHGKQKKSSSLDRNRVNYVSRGIQTSFRFDSSEKDQDRLQDELEKISIKSGEEKEMIEENVRQLVEDNLEQNDEKEEKTPRETRDTNFSSNELTNSTNNLGNQLVSELSESSHSQTKSNLPSKIKSSVPKHRLGVVPKYLLERKEALLKEKQEKEAELAQATCPEGHILLPDQERKDTLAMLKKNYQDCINELNRLPIRSDTLRAHQKKMELEKKMNKLEDGIKVFSRPKVFVKINT